MTADELAKRLVALGDGRITTAEAIANIRAVRKRWLEAFPSLQDWLSRLLLIALLLSGCGPYPRRVTQLPDIHACAAFCAPDAVRYWAASPKHTRCTCHGTP